MSLAPLKFVNSSGNLSYVVLNLSMLKSELNTLSSDTPKLITRFGDGRKLPFQARVYLGGMPSKQQLSKKRKMIANCH